MVLSQSLRLADTPFRCHDDTLNDPRIANTLIDINTRSPEAGGSAAWLAPGGIGPPNTWTGFLTRLCSQCEVYEQTRYLEFMRTAQIAPTATLVASLTDFYGPDPRRFGNRWAAG